MKTKIFAAITVASLLSLGAYAQDTTATMTKKEMRQQEKADRKARVKQDLKNTGQAIGQTADDAGQGIKRKAKVAGAAIDSTADRTGRAINRGLDKAETGLTNEANKIKARRDSSKVRRDSL